MNIFTTYFAFLTPHISFLPFLYVFPSHLEPNLPRDGKAKGIGVVDTDCT